MADYQVYVITHECLKPWYLPFGRFEDYQFVDQLIPEDRENICHVIGKFAACHKRRIQIDNYFLMNLSAFSRVAGALPGEILKKVVDYEKAEKMNPPMENAKNHSDQGT